MKTKQTSGPIYYVYALMDIRYPGPFKYGRYTFAFKPFYIGKGKGSRHDAHTRKAHGTEADSKSQKNIKIRNIVKRTGKGPAVKHIKENMLEQEAFDFERKLVQRIGRIQLKTGPLTNLSDGGEGQKNSLMTYEMRVARSKISKAWWNSLSDEYIAEHVAKVRHTKSERTVEQIALESKRKSKSGKEYLASQTPEQVRARSAAYIVSCLARTEEQRAKMGSKISSARRTFFDNLPDKEYARFHKRVARKNRAQWLALSDEQRDDIVNRRARGMQRHWDSMSTEDRAGFGATVSTALAARGPDKEALRKRRIGRSLKAAHIADPSIRANGGKRAAATKSDWTEEQRAEFVANCSLGKANRSEEQKALTSKRMSRSGKKRVAAMTTEDHERQSQALSKGIKAAWDLVPEDERAERINKAQASRDTKKIAKKISASVSRVHASRSPKQAAAIAAKIAQTLKNKSPADRQRLSAGNFARGLMKRNQLDVHHVVIRPKIDALIDKTKFDGSEETMAKFRTRCERIVNAWRPI